MQLSELFEYGFLLHVVVSEWDTHTVYTVKPH